MPKKNYYNVNQEYAEKFYQLPMVFFTNEKYKPLKLETKVAYAILKDRFSYSVKNNWVDDNGNIYFIFTNQELMNMLNCAKEKVVKIKKELEKANLLEQKRIGLNQPNRLYLLRPEVNADDVYLISHHNDPSALQPQGSSIFELPDHKASALQPQGSSIFELPENGAPALQPQGSSKIEPYLYYTSSEDTIKTQENTQLDFSPSNYTPAEIDAQNKDLVKNAANYYTQTDTKDTVIFNQDTYKLLSMWVKTPKDLARITGIVLNAKNSVVKELKKQNIKYAEAVLNIDGNRKLSSSDIQFLNEMGIEPHKLQKEISNTMRRVLNRTRRIYDEGKKVNIENYIFGAYKNMFQNYADEILEKREAISN